MTTVQIDGFQMNVTGTLKALKRLDGEDDRDQETDLGYHILWRGIMNISQAECDNRVPHKTDASGMVDPSKPRLEVKYTAP